VLDQLRRADYFELGTDGPEGKGRPIQIVDGHAQPTRALVDFLDGRPGPGSGPNRGGGSVDDRFDAAA
jgi:hypothetical protein